MCLHTNIFVTFECKASIIVHASPKDGHTDLGSVYNIKTIYCKDCGEVMRVYTSRYNPDFNSVEDIVKHVRRVRKQYMKSEEILGGNK